MTARSESKAKDLAERRPRFKDLLEVVITGDLTTVGAFDGLAKDVDVTIHCASVSYSSSPPSIYWRESWGESLSDPTPWSVDAAFRTLNANPLRRYSL